MSEVSTHDGKAIVIEPAISWAAIFAGAVVALAASVFLSLLAAGFGFDLAAGGLSTRRSLAAFTPEAVFTRKPVPS